MKRTPCQVYILLAQIANQKLLLCCLLATRQAGDEYVNISAASALTYSVAL